MELEYLISIILLSIIPSAIILFYKRNLIKPMLKVIPIVFVTGVLWDYLAVSRGWWSYAGRPYMLGISFIGVPLEDYLFIIFASMTIICLWEVLKEKLKFFKNKDR